MLSRIKVPHYAYLILVGCCLTNVGGFSLVYDIAGVYLVPVSTGLGISSADVALWLTADGIISVVSMPIAGILLRNRRMNLFMAGGTLLAAAGVFGFSLCSEPWHFALCGCLTGLGMPYLYGIAQVTLIGNWFSVERQGRMLGIVMACQGLSAALWAPFFTLLIQGVGFRLAYRINALLILVIVLPWTLFVFRGSPAQKGLGPCCRAKRRAGAQHAGRRRGRRGFLERLLRTAASGSR